MSPEVQFSRQEDRRRPYGRRLVALDADRGRRGVGNLWIFQVLRRAGLGQGQGGKPSTLGDEEAVGGDAECRVLVEAPPAPALVVAESDPLLQVLVVALDPPAELVSPDEFWERSALGLRRQPVLRRLLAPLGLLDQQPLDGVRRRSTEVAMVRSHSKRSEPARHQAGAALAPCRSAPSLGRQGMSQNETGHGLVIFVPAKLFGGCPRPEYSLGGRSPSPGRHTLTFFETPTT